MRDLVMVSAVLSLAVFSQAAGQLATYPFTESFDESSTLPEGWSLTGFELSTSVPRSSPNCLLVRGNLTLQTVTTPDIDASGRTLRSLHWSERRSGTAVPFDLRVYHESGAGRILLGRFDTIPAANSYQDRTIDLTAFPSIASSQGRFVFELRPDSTSSSGVLRIDDMGVITDPLADLSLSVSVSSTSRLLLGEEGWLPILIRNIREREAYGARLEVSIHQADAGAPTARRIIDLPPITAGDSIEIRHPFLADAFGRHIAFCMLVWPDDQNTANDTASVSFDVGYAPGTAVISEFMFAPSREDEPEWIEIFNPGPHVIDGSYLTLSDKGAQHVIVSPTAFLIVPGEYAVIAASQTFGEVYDLSGIQWRVARFPTLNNTTPDAIVLRDGYGITLDSMAYDPVWGKPGTSIERRDWLLPSVQPNTWEPSRSALGATPGRANSVQRAMLNVRLDSVHAELLNDRPVIRIVAYVANNGRETVSSGAADIFVTSPLPGSDPIPLGTLLVPRIAPDASAVMTFECPPVSEGPVTIEVRLRIPGDMDRSDDTLMAPLRIPFAPASLIVNEIMFDPVPGECEWIELFNPRDAGILLEAWSTSDLPTASGQLTRIELRTDVFIRAGGFAVIAGDSSLFGRFSWLRDEPYRSQVVLLQRSGGLGLNASADGIVLRDPAGRTIDSVTYSADWHLPSVDAEGRSLERLRTDIPGTEERAWTSSPGPFKASPARPNASSPIAHPPGSSVSISPNPFSPDGDGYEDLALISCSFAVPSVFLKALVFDDRGRRVRSLADGGLFGGHDLITWDGTDDSGRRVRRGPYILVIEAWNPVESFSSGQKHVIVVAR